VILYLLDCFKDITTQPFLTNGSVVTLDVGVLLRLTVRVRNNTGDGVECSDARENTIEVTLGKHLLLSGEITRIGYSVGMSFLLRKIVRYVAQKAASDPASREKVLRIAASVAAETKQIAKENDRAYAAGRALRRAFEKSQNNR
jgi:hypothetical protein